MTVSQWIKENSKQYKFAEFTVVDENNKIIVDDRLAYLASRSAEYNKSWKSKCRGKKIVSTNRTEKGIIIRIA